VVHEYVRPDDDPTRVGFVVGRSVGNAVVRNRVKRRLRHLMADRLSDLPPHSSLVVRVNPGADDLTPIDLEQQLDLTLAAAAKRLSARASISGGAPS